MEVLKCLTRQIIELLVKCDYRQVGERTFGVRFSEQEMRSAIAEYGRILMPPPENAYDEMIVNEVRVPRIIGIRQWAVTMPLWTREEGRSDLTVELTILESDPLVIELDDIHVL